MVCLRPRINTSVTSRLMMAHTIGYHGDGQPRPISKPGLGSPVIGGDDDPFRSLLCATFFLAGSVIGCAGSRPQASASGYPPRPVQLAPIDSCSTDARILACSLSEGPWIDRAVAVEIDSALARARTLRPDLESI